MKKFVIINLANNLYVRDCYEQKITYSYEYKENNVAFVASINSATRFEDLEDAESYLSSLSGSYDIKSIYWNK